MEFGLALMNHYGSWEDVAFAESHGFHTAGFVESPLIAADPFACMALAAQATSRIRLGTLLSTPGLRDTASLAAGVATINRLAPGRVFLTMGTGNTARSTFGLKGLAAHRVRDAAQSVRGLLNGEEVGHQIGQAQRAIRFSHGSSRACIDTTSPLPIYIAADGPKALEAAGQAGDGLVMALMHAQTPEDQPRVLRENVARATAAARAAGRNLEHPYVMLSTAMCIVEPGESLLSERVVNLLGPLAISPFHVYACRPEIGEYFPPVLRDQIPVYEREVLSRMPRENRYQRVHAGHLTHLLDGEAAVLTEEIMASNYLIGTAEQIAAHLLRLEDAGLSNLTLSAPPDFTRTVVTDVAEKIMPLMRSQIASKAVSRA